MSSYIHVIKQAFLFFPIVAAIFTLPYILYNYRKYGTAIWIRNLIIYSFILYLICVFFLVLLPLPSKEFVSKLTSPRASFIPFQFVLDMIKEAQKSNIKGLMAYINNPALFQFLFNILMLLPFGVYLHYYFNCNLKKTVLCSFLLSLFFEITQLTGIFFIYPRGYRLFDVDDLMANTLGGFIGYYVANVLAKFLPSREEIDQESYKKGEQVSFLRRTISFICDLGMIILITMVTSIILAILSINVSHLEKIIAFIYFTFVVYFKHGQTYGMRITKIKIISDDDEPVRLFQLILRFILFCLYLIALPYIFTTALYAIHHTGLLSLSIYLILEIMLITCFLFSILFLQIHMISRKQVFYEKYSSTKYISTVTYNDSKIKGTK